MNKWAYLIESDGRIRNLEKALIENPGDTAVLYALRAARIRAGLPAWNKEMVDTLGRSKALILHPSGGLKEVKNLGWLIRNARDHDSFIVERVGRGAMLRCLMQDKRWYETFWHDPNVLWDWLNRPSLRGSDLDWMGFETIVGGPRPPGVTAHKRHEVRKSASGVGYVRVDRAYDRG